MRCSACWLALAVAFLAVPLLADRSDRGTDRKADEKKETEAGKDARAVQAAAWVGYSSYAMKDFDRKLSVEGNAAINGGLNAGVEVSVAALGKGKGLEINIPMGVEFLTASSKTTHSAAEGSATVNWSLPVVGFYIGPRIVFGKKPGAVFYLRPVAAGFYDLGNFIKAKLTVSDRPGSLGVSSTTVGVTSVVGGGYRDEGGVLRFFIEGGYRILKFTDVSQSPRGGFASLAGGAAIQPGNLRETLDYSGFVVRMGTSF